jgi:hypothetical protein
MRGVIFFGVDSLDNVGTWGYEKLGNDDVLSDPIRQDPHFVPISFASTNRHATVRTWS